MKMFRRNTGFKVMAGAVLLCILAFAAGCVISPRRIVGGGTGGTSGGPTPTPTPGTGAAGKLYVANLGSNSIARFDNASTADGNLAPGGVIAGAQTQLNSPQHIFVDAAADNLYVANQGGGSVLVFDAASTRSGNVPPARSLGGASTGLLLPADVAVDSGKNLLYVADSRDVFVFSSASTVSGNVPFTRDIQVGFIIAAMFLDSTNDRLFLADSGANAINVYDNASTLNLKAAPSRVVTGAATQLNQPSGIGIDAVGKLIVSNSGNNSITVYANAAAANGALVPVIILSGANTTLNLPSQIAVNRSNTRVEVFAANVNSGNVPIFSDLGATSGNIAPSRNITGASTGLTGAHGITLDTTR